MKRISFACGLFGLVAGLLTGVAAFAADWTVYRDKAYSCSMLMPAGTKFSTREYGGGWGGMTANFEGVRFHGIAKLGRRVTTSSIWRRRLPVSRRTGPITTSGMRQCGWTSRVGAGRRP